ncbi:MAG TPA: S8 family serine peptidase [Mycobacteriales bacterium]|nr:S8 family serine peptidase [Mycobacteriales bacterium]
MPKHLRAPQHAPRGRRLALTAALAALASSAAVGAALPAGAAVPPLPDMASVARVVGAQTGWQSGATGRGIDVAVLDTGVTPVQGLHAADKVVYGPDLSFDSQNPDLAYLDGYGHGTAIAGIIAGNDGTAGGYTGVAPDARIVSVKVGASNGAVDVSQMIAGIDWVVQHARDPGMNIRVLNLSLGTNSVQSYQLDPLAHAAEVAWRKGIVVVVAVGNDGTDSNNVADPAIDPYLLAVGAEDPQGTVAYNDDTVASFSQRGTGSRHADVVAPGAYVMGLLSPGSTLATANPNAVFGGRYLRGSGTSQAAAVVSGVVADLLSARPNLTPDQVKGILAASAVRIGTPNPNFTGAGLVQLPGALTATAPTSTQSFPASNGNGSLHQARGTGRVVHNGVALTGEQDIFGHGWSSPAISAAEESGSAWSGGSFNGSTWSGSTWSGSTWSGSTWSGSTWSGSTWSGSTWSGEVWLGATWN